MTFAEWLQSRLVAHGFSLVIDGAIGGATKHAILLFQQREHLPMTGVADAATVEALRREPGADAGTPAAVSSPPPAETMPPWMAEMYRKVGLNETRDNAALIEWLKGGQYLGDPAKLPWCGDGVETAFARTLPFEPLPAHPFFAQSWATFGVKLAGPAVGAVGVIRWSASAGHVGFVAGVNGDHIVMLGANQSDSIKLASFPRSKFIAFRWAKTYPFKVYPPLSGHAPAITGIAATR